MNAEHLLQTAHRLMELGDFEQAESCYTDLIREGVYRIEVYNNRGSARFSLKKFEKAIGDYTQAIRINPRIDYPHFNRANCKAELGDYPGAIRDYERALQFNPAHSASHFNRALTYQKKGEHTRALEDFDTCLRMAPEINIPVYRARSESYFSLGKEAEAIKDLLKVIRAEPEDKQLRIRLVDIYIERNAYKEALELCKQGLRIYKEDTEFKLKRAEVYIAAGAPALAWTDLGEIEAHEGQQDQYFFLKGQILDSLGRIPEAIACFEKSLAKSPKQFEAWIFLGGLYLKKQAFPEALQAATSAQKLNKDFPESYLLSARAHYEMAKHFACIADLERYENRGGKLSEAWLLKGFVLLERDRISEAQRAFDKAVQVNPTSADAFLGRGNAYLLSSQFAKALTAYEKALDISPRLGVAIFNKGVALKKLGKDELAFEAWEKAAKLQHPKAETYLRRYRKDPHA